LAAQAGVRYSLTNPFAYVDSNLAGFTAILEGCRHNAVEHLAYASSSSVYGANTGMPFSVHHNVDHPLSLYAATKKANELMAHTYSHLYGLPTTGLRFFTVYGPWGRPDMALFLFTKAILEGRPIDVFNHGKMRRDFTYVDDIVEGILRTADRVAGRALDNRTVLEQVVDAADELLALLAAEVALEAELRAQSPTVRVEANARRGIGVEESHAQADGRVPRVVLGKGRNGSGKEDEDRGEALLHGGILGCRASMIRLRRTDAAQLHLRACVGLLDQGVPMKK